MKEFSLKNAEIKFVYVDPGEFLMGSSIPNPMEDRDLWSNNYEMRKLLYGHLDNWRFESEPYCYSYCKDIDWEKIHPVKISNGIYIGKTAVTQKQWFQIMGSKPWKDYRSSAPSRYEFCGMGGDKPLWIIWNYKLSSLIPKYLLESKYDMKDFRAVHKILEKYLWEMEVDMPLDIKNYECGIFPDFNFWSPEHYGFPNDFDYENAKNIFNDFIDWASKYGILSPFNMPINENIARVEFGDDYPATYVNYNDIEKFLSKLNMQYKPMKFRLPTEAEWEYCCRAGSQSDFCFGDNVAKLKEYGWYGQENTLTPYDHFSDFAHENGRLEHYYKYSPFRDKTKNAIERLADFGNEAYNELLATERDREHHRDSIEPYPHPVARKKPNYWGLYDMHGNVYEFCEDLFYKYEYPNGLHGKPLLSINPRNVEKRLNALGEKDNDDVRPYPCKDFGRVIRGGCVFSLPYQCRSATRYHLSEKIRSIAVGFRIVMEK